MAIDPETREQLDAIDRQLLGMQMCIDGLFKTLDVEKVWRAALQSLLRKKGVLTDAELKDVGRTIDEIARLEAMAAPDTEEIRRLRLLVEGLEST